LSWEPQGSLHEEKGQPSSPWKKEESKLGLTLRTDRRLIQPARKNAKTVKKLFRKEKGSRLDRSVLKKGMY